VGGVGSKLKQLGLVGSIHELPLLLFTTNNSLIQFDRFDLQLLTSYSPLPAPIVENCKNLENIAYLPLF
jgi:hypothetical protein